MSEPARAFGDLPGILADVAEAGGLALAGALAKAFGGRRIYIPRPENMAEHHPVARALIGQGHTLAEARLVADLLGGAFVDVPFGPFAGAGVRKRAANAEFRRGVVDQLNAGATHTEVAASYEIAERSVYRIKAELKAGPASETALPLFPDQDQAGPATKHRP